jgi:PTS system galactitol-specific IIC component
MEVLLTTIKAVVGGLGATVLLSIVIFFIALALAAKPGRAFRAGITIGAAFIGINLVIGLMWTNLSDVAKAIVTNTGVKRDIVEVGWSSAAASALVLAPIAILLSVILPGDRVILFADLAVIPFLVATAAPVANGDIFRIVIIGAITLAIGFYVGMALSPLFTGAATAAGFKLPENAAQITSICDGFAWVPWLVVSLGQSLGWLGLLIVAALTAVGIFLYRRCPTALEALAGEHDELEAAELT